MLGLLLGLAVSAPDLGLVRDETRTLVDVERVETSTLAVREPLSGRRLVFRGRPTVELLDAAVGPTWREAAQVVFHCDDGYASRVEVAELLRVRSLLAHGLVGEGSFEVRREDGERIPLGPYYLVWAEPGVKTWPYRVLAIEPVRRGEGLEAAEPPPGSSPRVLAGARAFARHCVACHAVNGAGGEVGPELNYPVSVVDYMRPRWLKVWLLAPRQIRAGTSMPGLPEGLERRDEVADDIIAYLSAMRAKKIPSR